MRISAHDWHMKRIDFANRIGLCYCDSHHLCAIHSKLFHKTYAESIGNKEWHGIEKMISDVIKDNPVEKYEV